MKVLEQVIEQEWALYNGDSIEVLQALPAASVGLSVFSPPFQDLYVYSPSERDMGNSQSPEQFWMHFGFLIPQLLRVTAPGRLCCVHVAQVPSQLAKDGVIGLKDFRGDTIRAFQAGGWIFHREAVIAKNPQAQAIRTHSKALLFTQLRKDSTWSGPALNDYIAIFRAPGDNPHPVHPDITNDTWIEWASGIWLDVEESDTLNVAEARTSDDERHICPLQLGTIERCIRLWSNPGDVVLDPFSGIGSTGFEALRLGRRFVGVELKPSYYTTAVRNVRRAEASRERRGLFDGMGQTG